MPIQRKDNDPPVTTDIPVDPADWNIPVKGADGQYHYADTRTRAEKERDNAEAQPGPDNRDVYTLPTDATPDEITKLVRAVKGEPTEDEG